MKINNGGFSFFSATLVAFVLGAFLLSSCSSLPQPADDYGLVALLIEAENDSERDWLVRYRVDMVGPETRLWFNPSNTLLIRQLPPGWYEVQGISAVQIEEIESMGSQTPLRGSFKVEAGAITLFPFKARIRQHPVQGRPGWTTQRQNFDPLTARNRSEMLENLAERENIELWRILE